MGEREKEEMVNYHKFGWCDSFSQNHFGAPRFWGQFEVIIIGVKVNPRTCYVIVWQEIKTAYRTFYRTPPFFIHINPLYHVPGLPGFQFAGSTTASRISRRKLAWKSLFFISYQRLPSKRGIKVFRSVFRSDSTFGLRSSLTSSCHVWPWTFYPHSKWRHLIINMYLILCKHLMWNSLCHQKMISSPSYIFKEIFHVYKQYNKPKSFDNDIKITNHAHACILVTQHAINNRTILFLWWPNISFNENCLMIYIVKNYRVRVKNRFYVRVSFPKTKFE